MAKAKKKCKVQGLINSLKFDEHTQNFEQAKSEFLNAVKNVKSLSQESFAIYEQLKTKLQNAITKVNIELIELEQAKQHAQEFANIQAQLNNFINLQDRTIRENSSPFMAQNGKKTQLFKARINVFIKALALHKAAILANGNKFTTNLKMFDSKDLFQLNDAQKLNILQSLFIVVPVISTTFASMSRFFNKYCVGKNDIGMMLVDEAGQANISNAVGALWRAKNAVIVGDPLQLEPVVTLPSDLNKVLLAHAGAKDEFNVATTSLQARADKVQILGAYIGQTWVGSPLIVHRRCDEPMFGVANDTTYDGAMIWGRKKNAGFLGEYGVKSEWIDVGGNFNGNYSKEQLNAADELYEKLCKIIENYNAYAKKFNETCTLGEQKPILNAKKRYPSHNAIY